MRPQTEYIITKSEVHAYAEDWLGTAIRLSIRVTNVRDRCLLQVLLIAAARVVSLFAVCRRSGRCPDGSNDSQCPGGHVAGNDRTRTPTELGLGHACAQGLATQVPHGGDRFDADSLSRQPALREKEIFRGEPKSGTTHFHAYATAVVLHKGLSLHLGHHARRVRRLDERGAPDGCWRLSVGGA